MALLDETFGTDVVNLDDFIPTVPNISTPPRGALRNRASTTALLSSDPSKAVENYQLMMAESEQGQDATYQALKASTQERTNKADQKGLMSLLADPTVAIEEKRKAIDNMGSAAFLRDGTTTLHTDYLTSPSAGENVEQEDARISTADIVKEIYRSREEVQGIYNALGATLDPASLETVADMAAVWVLPLGNNVSVGRFKKEFSKDEKSLWERFKGFILPGTATADIREKLESIPPAQRPEFAKKLVEIIKNNTGVVFANDNQFAQYEKASAVFEQGGYSSTQEFLDNVSPLLDVLGLGQLARGAGKGAKALKGGKGMPPLQTPPTSASREVVPVGERVQHVEWELVDEPVAPGPQGPRRIGEGQKLLPGPESKLEDTVKRIELNTPVRREVPVSPASVAQQTNPEKARAIHETIVSSGGDEVAEGLAGVSKEQAVINDVFPQADSGSGTVISKVMDIGRNLRQRIQIPPELAGLVRSIGSVNYSPKELSQARSNLVRDFTNAEGLTMNEAMSSFRHENGRFFINAVYGTSDGSFLKAAEAMEQAKSALRNYGIRDEDIVLLKKDGLDHTPVNLADEADLDGNFLIQIRTEHEIDPTDISNYDRTTVKYNFFDRISQLVWNTQGSVSRLLFDAPSMFDPIYTHASSVATEQSARFEKYMLDQAAKYSDKFDNFSKERKAKIDEYIREANYNGIDFDPASLTARGFSPEEIDALKSWKDFWDGHYYLENYDMIRSLNSEGYQLFKNTQDELYARPIQKNQNLGNIYDPSIQDVITHTKAEGDALYNSGGTYAKLRRPVDINGTTVEYMLVRNTPTEFLRKFRDTDFVLNYRPGYFQLKYKAPRFVDEIVRDSNGAITSRRAVAVAGDTKEAELFAKRMQTSTGSEYIVRGDDRALRRGSDDWWDVNSASGRIAQRQRGKLLEDASGLNHLGDGSYIVDPVTSAISAAKSISGRTVSRPMLESAKARAIQQYGDLFPKKDGQTQWPSKVGDIGAKGEHFSSRTADARSTWEYINYLQNGYVNGVDESIKGVFNALAELVGKKGFSRTERGLQWVGDLGPTQLFKNGVFNAYIAMNPLRQLIVQTHQVVRTWSYNPVGWVTGSVERYMGEYLGGTVGLPRSAKGAEFSKFIDESGLLDSVDKQNLVNGTLKAAADHANPVSRTLGAPIRFARQIGFDLGERGNQLGHAAAVWDRYKRLGRDTNSSEVRAKMISEVKAISYEMNFAGDLPYNQTSAAMVLQFMQVPHKALLQATNRKIDTGVRLRMILADMAIWGSPIPLIHGVFSDDVLPDNPELREAYLWGVESMMWNEALSSLSGEDVNIDFSSLAPYDLSGWARFFQEGVGGGLGEMFLNSPAGQLFFKDGSRLDNVLATMSRFWNPVDDVDTVPQVFIDTMNEVAKISSGWNNAYKAKILLDAQQRFDQYGNAIDRTVNHTEAWAQVFGFGTADTRDLYRVSKEITANTKAHKEEVLKVYNDIRKYYQDQFQSGVRDPEHMTKVTGRLLKVFENDPEGMAIIRQQLRQDLRGKDQQLLYQMMKSAGLPDNGGADLIRQAPIDDEQKKMMLERLNDIKRARSQKVEE